MKLLVGTRLVGAEAHPARQNEGGASRIRSLHEGIPRIRQCCRSQIDGARPGSHEPAVLTSNRSPVAVTAGAGAEKPVAGRARRAGSAGCFRENTADFQVKPEWWKPSCKKTMGQPRSSAGG